MIEGFGKRFKEAVDIAGGRVKASKIMGVVENTVANYEKNATPPTLEPVALLVDHVGMSLDYVVYGKGGDGEYVLIPRLNIKAALGPGYEVNMEQVVCKEDMRDALSAFFNDKDDELYQKATWDSLHVVAASKKINVGRCIPNKLVTKQFPVKDLADVPHAGTFEPIKAQIQNFKKQMEELEKEWNS